jgi:NAD(P)-dependent dehydrogenase (short-subunit alcohol dehydrogenase family)
MGRLTGRTALVTGGTTGIGFSAAELFLREGARVAITGQDAGRIADARRALGESVVAIRCDAGRVEELGLLTARISDSFGKLDILFLNAGLAKYGALDQVSEADFDQVFNINVKGVLFPVKHLAPLMGSGGSIIVTTSINDRIGMDSTHIYAASKAAARQLVRTLAGELARRGIRVNALSPGPTITAMGPKTGLNDAQMHELADWVISQVPLRRFATADELASAALFLASSDASFVTGHELTVDGGWTGVNANFQSLLK